MDIKNILEFIRRTNPSITEKELLEVLVNNYNITALCLMASNINTK